MFVFNAILPPALTPNLFALNTARILRTLCIIHITPKYLMQYSDKNRGNPVKIGENVAFLRKRRELRVKNTPLCGLYAKIRLELNVRGGLERYGNRLIKRKVRQI